MVSRLSGLKQERKGARYQLDARIVLGEHVQVILRGRPIHPGVSHAPTRLITPHDLAELHHARYHLESDQELQEIFRSPGFRLRSLADLRGAPRDNPDEHALLEVTFWSAVNEVLESRGSGIIFSVASVISRYLRSAAFSLNPESQEGYRCLAELGKAVLAGLLRFRRSKYATSPRYIVLATSLNLQEAVSLPPRIVGYAIGTGVDRKLKIAAELLDVPAVTGLEVLEEKARALPFARLDGGAGTLEEVSESDSGSRTPP
jgi:hypothetical protein